MVFLLNDPNNFKELNENILDNNIYKNILLNNILFYNNYNNICRQIKLSQEEYLDYLKSNIITPQKKRKTKYIMFKNAILFHSLTRRNIIQHFMLDYKSQINYYYNFLINNPMIKIIIEFINFKKRTNFNIIIKFCKYLEDIGLKNKIYIVTNKDKNYYYSNENIIDVNNKIYIRNLKLLHIENSLKFLEIKFLYLNVPDPTTKENFHDKLKYLILPNIIKNKNIKFEKKFLIIEERITKKIEGRGFTIKEWNDINVFCKNYCLNNNLELLIWNGNITKKSIIEQQLLCYNAEIIISLGGSFNLFNIGNTCSHIIIFDIEIQRKRKINDNIKYFTYTIFNSYSNDIKLYFHFKNINDDKNFKTNKLRNILN